MITAAMCLAPMAGCGGAAFVLGTDAGGADTGVSGDDGSTADTGVPTDAGGLEDGPAIDAGSGTDAGGSPLCPTSPAARASACPRVGLACEYGTSTNVACDTVVMCMASGWSVTEAVSCPMGTCPATYDAVPMGEACAPSGLGCGYAKGTCICSSSTGPIEVIDGAVAIDWHCFPAMTGCPSPRPRLGTPCVDAGVSCNYGACSGGVELSCDGGVWQEESVPCPL
ncbi:MAG TPA: hypothetical protein VGM06_09570 [Polyangiaceae bacterium]